MADAVYEIETLIIIMREATPVTVASLIVLSSSRGRRVVPP